MHFAGIACATVVIIIVCVLLHRPEDSRELPLGNALWVLDTNGVIHPPRSPKAMALLHELAATPWSTQRFERSVLLNETALRGGTLGNPLMLSLESFVKGYERAGTNQVSESAWFPASEK